MYVWPPSPCQILWDLQLLHDNETIKVKRETLYNIIKEQPLTDDDINEIECNEEYKKVSHIFNCKLGYIDSEFQKWKSEKKISLRNNVQYVATRTGIRNAHLPGGVSKVHFYDVTLLQDGTCSIDVGNGWPDYCDIIKDDGRIRTMNEWDVFYPPDYIITGTRANPMKFII